MEKHLKIQFGSGENKLEGWVNHEIDTADITKPLPYSDCSVDAILLEHCGEHVSTPEFFRFLNESWRILKFGSALFIALPVLDLLDRSHGIEMILCHGHMAAYTRDSLLKICRLSNFETVEELVSRPDFYGHWKIIGEKRDNLESCRIQLTK